MPKHSFTNKLLAWFDLNGRKDLPWQKNRTPYAVWVSEIMLQQTQVMTVIPYYTRFISHFPDVKSLAEANLDIVLHLWTGLGYYARARNLLKTAQIITEHYDQIFPDNLKELSHLPGIGRSTAGAILSIAFNKPFPILDGNVKRVLTRYHMVVGFPGDKQVENKLWEFAEKYIPKHHCYIYSQAIMDLGATICIRIKPKCEICPLQRQCMAFNEDKISDFPQKKSKAITRVRATYFLILQNDDGHVLLEKRSAHGIWGGLWSFPEYQNENYLEYCNQKFGYKVKNYQKGKPFRHTFSHFHLDITPIYIHISQSPLCVRENDLVWYLPSNMPQIGLAAPVKKLLLG
jgi:A/G-specific adenine glycosylase